MENEKNSFYTETEEEILNKVQNNLLNLTDKLIEKTNPDSPSYKSDIRVINEVYANISKGIDDRAKNRLKHDENNNKEATLDIVAGIITNLSKRKVEHKPNELYLESPDNLVPDDIVPGETDINPEKLDIADFVVDKKEE